MLATIRRLSTSATPPGSRLAYWNDAWASASGATVVDADRDSFQGVLTNLRAGRFEIASVRSTPAVTHSVGDQSKTGAGTFLLQLVHSGSCLVRHNALETELRAGDLFVADSRKPYGLVFEEPLHGLTVPVPWDRFAPSAEALEALAGRRIEAHAGAGAVLSGFLRGAWDHLAQGDGDDWPDAAEAVIWDLLDAVLQGDGARGIGAGRADQLRREARAHVDVRLSDPGFDSAELAGILGVSARYLQMVFAEVGTTPSRFLLARRLEAAASRLRRLDRPCSITAVALECGFNDLSYFSRCFRRRFGLAPLSYRLSLAAPAAEWQ
ncbi:MAG TPA: AraC family transcriptional regulator [Caulobacteraceae bacterium]